MSSTLPQPTRPIGRAQDRARTLAWDGGTGGSGAVTQLKQLKQRKQAGWVRPPTKTTDSRGRVSNLWWHTKPIVAPRGRLAASSGERLALGNAATATRTTRSGGGSASTGSSTGSAAGSDLPEKAEVLDWIRRTPALAALAPCCGGGAIDGLGNQGEDATGGLHAALRDGAVLLRLLGFYFPGYVETGTTPVASASASMATAGAAVLSHDAETSTERQWRLVLEGWDRILRAGSRASSPPGGDGGSGSGSGSGGNGMVDDTEAVVDSGEAALTVAFGAPPQRSDFTALKWFGTGGGGRAARTGANGVGNARGGHAAAALTLLSKLLQYLYRIGLERMPVEGTHGREDAPGAREADDLGADVGEVEGRGALSALSWDFDHYEQLVKRDDATSQGASSYASEYVSLSMGTGTVTRTSGASSGGGNATLPRARPARRRPRASQGVEHDAFMLLLEDARQRREARAHMLEAQNASPSAADFAASIADADYNDRSDISDTEGIGDTLLDSATDLANGPGGNGLGLDDEDETAVESALSAEDRLLRNVAEAVWADGDNHDKHLRSRPLLRDECIRCARAISTSLKQVARTEADIERHEVAVRSLEHELADLEEQVQMLEKGNAAQHSMPENIAVAEGGQGQELTPRRRLLSKHMGKTYAHYAIRLDGALSDLRESLLNGCKVQVDRSNGLPGVGAWIDGAYHEPGTAAAAAEAATAAVKVVTETEGEAEAHDKQRARLSAHLFAVHERLMASVGNLASDTSEHEGGKWLQTKIAGSLCAESAKLLFAHYEAWEEGNGPHFDIDAFMKAARASCSALLDAKSATAADDASVATASCKSSPLPTKSVSPAVASVVALSNRKRCALRRLRVQLHQHREELAAGLAKVKPLTLLAHTGANIHELPPSYRQLKRLHTLLLDGNRFVEVPAAVCSMPSLRTLSLSDNALARISPNLGSLSNLEELNVSGNQLGSTVSACATIPSALGALCRLKRLLLANNVLSALPTPMLQSLGDHSAMLEELDLSSNQLENLDPIALSASSLETLRILRLGSNRLLCIPGSIGNLKQLRRLELHENSIDMLPREMGELGSLRYLTLHQNRLSLAANDWPSFEAMLPRGLTELTLHANQLTDVPVGVFKALCRTRTFSMHSNMVDRLTARSLESLGQCTELDLHANRLVSLPSSIAAMPRLQVAKLNGNMLTRLPALVPAHPVVGDRMSSLSRTLTTLELQDNQLTSLPPDIGKLASMTSLHLSRNMLTVLPATLVQARSLKELRLDGNPLASPLREIVATCSYATPVERIFVGAMHKIVDGLSPYAETFRAGAGDEKADAAYNASAVAALVRRPRGQARRGAARHVASYIERQFYEDERMRASIEDEGTIASIDFDAWIMRHGIALSEKDLCEVHNHGFGGPHSIADSCFGGVSDSVRSDASGPSGAEIDGTTALDSSAAARSAGTAANFDALRPDAFIDCIERSWRSPPPLTLAQAVLKYLHVKAALAETSARSKNNEADDNVDEDTVADVQSMRLASSKRMSWIAHLEEALIKTQATRDVPTRIRDLLKRVKEDVERQQGRGKRDGGDARARLNLTLKQRMEAKRNTAKQLKSDQEALRRQLREQELVLAELRNTLRAKAPQYEALVTDALIQQQTRRAPSDARAQQHGRRDKAATKHKRGGLAATGPGAKHSVGALGADDEDDEATATRGGVDAAASTPEEVEEFVLVEDVASAVTFRVRLANGDGALQVGHLKQEIAHTRKLKATDITLLFTHSGKRLAKLKDTAALTDVGVSHGSELKMLLNMSKTRKERFEAEFESVLELGKNTGNTD